MEDEDLSQEGRGLDPTPLLLHDLIRTTPTPTTTSSPITNSTTNTTTTTNNNRPFSFLLNAAANHRIISESSSSMLNIPDSSNAQLDDRQNDWGYSKPVVFLDVIWNLAFVLVSSVVLFSTLRERPSTPLRVWVVGYALQCLFHVGFVYYEYRRRRRRTSAVVVGRGDEDDDELSLSSENRKNSVVKRLESMNTMVSFFWWVIGFYWIVVGGQALLQDAPRLYWLAVVFLAFDVFFAIFCIALACIIGVVLCCCLPCIIAILYAVAVQEGASEDDIKILPRYKFRQINQPGTIDSNKNQEVAIPLMNSGSSDSMSELALPPEDSECCICLSQYVDGVELHTLPCNHHFHCGCIDKWLRINATCPLCKYNILHGDELV